MSTTMAGTVWYGNGLADENYFQPAVEVWMRTPFHKFHFSSGSGIQVEDCALHPRYHSTTQKFQVP